MKKDRQHPGCARPGMKFCARQPKCKKQIPFDGPPICPKHGTACAACKGSGKIIHSWNIGENKPPRHKTCPDCGGKGIVRPVEKRDGGLSSFEKAKMNMPPIC